MKTTENALLIESSAPEKKVWMVGFFDVLGFSARVEKDGVDKVYDDYCKLLENVLNKPGIETAGMIAETFMGGTLFSMGGKVDVSYAYFSDTILLWLPFEPPYPKLFLQRCADLMCEALLMGIPLRGAIAVGEGYMHKQTGIYLGQPIVDGARLEAAQEQIGVGMATSVVNSLLIPSADPTQFIEYDIPIKKHLKESWPPIALDWPRRWRDCNHGNLIQYLEKLRPDEELASTKYNNTIEFVKWSEAHNDWYECPEKRVDFKYLREVPHEEIARNPELFPDQWLQMRAHVRPISKL